MTAEPVSGAGPPRVPAAPGPPPRGFPEEASAVIGLLFGGALAVLIVMNWGYDIAGPVDRFVAGLALGVLALLPGVLAMLGRWRPALYLAAGVLGFPLMVMLFTIVGAPLVLSSVLALVAYERRQADSIPRVAAPIIAVLTLVIALAAFRLMFIHENPRSLSTATTSLYVSDVVTRYEGLASLAVSVVGTIVLWVLARPRRITTQARDE